MNDLEKASESANHENGLLRAQVERLNSELKDYRKRMSLNAGGTPSRTPPQGASLGLTSQVSRSSGPFGHTNNFSFDFPTFGSGLQSYANEPSQVADGARQDRARQLSKELYGVPGVIRSNGQSLTSASGVVSRQPQTTPGNQPIGVGSLNGLVSPTTRVAAGGGSGREAPFDSTAAANAHSTSRQNSGGSNIISNSPAYAFIHQSSTSSPSATNSSASTKGPASSCGTSPEASTCSPLNGNSKPLDSSLQTINEEHRDGLAQGSINGLPTTSIDSTLPALSKTSTATSELNGIDWLAQQNGGQFDPVLFGDYRESQDNITSGDYDTFFNEAFPLPDLASPFNEELTATLSQNKSQPQNDLSSKAQPVMEEKPLSDPCKEIAFGHNQIWYISRVRIV